MKGNLYMYNIPRLTAIRCSKEDTIDKVILTPLTVDEDAILDYTKWINDEDIVHWVDHSYKITTIEEERKWATSDTGEMKFSIYIDAQYSAPQLIGTCTITLSSCNTNATFGILIGDKHWRGKGVGLTVVKMLTKYAFEELRVHRCHLIMVEDNDRALNCYTNAGFTVCGTEHECFWYHGHYANVLHLEYLFDDYVNKKMQEFINNDIIPEEIFEDSK